MPYIKFLSLFREFGSNSSVASNSGIVIRDLSWKFVSRSSLHYFSMDVISRAQTLWTVVTTDKTNSFFR